MLYVARQACGEIRSVCARRGVHLQRDERPFQPANDAAMLLLEFATGAQAFVQLSHSTPPGVHETQQHFVAHGDAGMLEADLADPARVLIYGTRDGRREHLPVPAEWWGDVDPAKPYDVFERQP